MASYRRFVAYVYRYRKGRKGDNCGFVKVEARNGLCTFYLRLQGVDIPDMVRVFVFVRKEKGADFLLLGQAEVKDGILHQRLDTDRLHMGGSGYTLEQCGGLVCVGNADLYYGTVWDKQEIVPRWEEQQENRRIQNEKIETEKGSAEGEEASENAFIEKTTTVSEMKAAAKVSGTKSEKADVEGSAWEEQQEADAEMPEAKDTKADAEIPGAKDKKTDAMGHAQEEQELPAEPQVPEKEEIITAEVEPEQSNADRTASALESPVQNSFLSTGESREKARISSVKENKSITPEQKICEERTGITVQEKSRWIQPLEHMEKRQNTDEKMSFGGEENSASKCSKPKCFEEIWTHLQKTCMPLEPFEDGGIVEGIKIAPSDIPYLQEQNWNLGSNRFLLHGYKNYRHLLLGRLEGQKRYVLGVPGVYDQQEQFMAKMFGFPQFKPIRQCRCRVGQFGYWLRSIR